MFNGHNLVKLYDEKNDFPFLTIIKGIDGQKYYGCITAQQIFVTSCRFRIPYPNLICTLCGENVSEYKQKSLWGKPYIVCEKEMCNTVYNSAKMDMLASRFILRLSQKLILDRFASIVKVLKDNGFTKLEVFLIMSYYSL